LARYRVLFVDDEPAILRSLGDYFEKLGHDVYRADTGKAGIAMFERVKPDVTVLDPDVEWNYDRAQSVSKSKNSPFHGWRLKGRATATIVTGKIVDCQC